MLFSYTYEHLKSLQLNNSNTFLTFFYEFFSLCYECTRTMKLSSHEDDLTRQLAVDAQKKEVGKQMKRKVPNISRSRDHHKHIRKYEKESLRK